MKYFFTSIFIFTAISAAVFCARISSAAPLDKPTVKITSFYAAEQNSKMAELCGKVSGMTEKTALVRVIVDENSGDPGIYHTTAEADGAFCVAVLTRSGTASVEVPFFGISSAKFHSSERK